MRSSRVIRELQAAEQEAAAFVHGLPFEIEGIERIRAAIARARQEAERDRPAIIQRLFALVSR